jgi:hypothetical protein
MKRNNKISNETPLLSPLRAGFSSTNTQSTDEEDDATHPSKKSPKTAGLGAKICFLVDHSKNSILVNRTEDLCSIFNSDSLSMPYVLSSVPMTAIMLVLRTLRESLKLCKIAWPQ